PSAAVPAVDVASRTAAVEQLLAARSRAVLGRDQVAFLATVDPAATALRARQAAVFDALGQVPLGTFDYDLEPLRERPADAALDGRYGREQWWAPDVFLRYGLEGFDERPTVVEHHLTFVRRGGRWLLAADDDFAAVGLETPRALWDNGPVVAVRAPGVLVLGHPGSKGLLGNVAELTSTAVSKVSSVWGQGWQRRVVVIVPSDAKEMAGLLGSDGDLSRIAAVATAELTGGGEYDPAGDRVVVNPTTFSTLSQLGRQVVLTHEVTHVATRQATGPAVPSWLAEGFADHVAYREVELPLSVSARELRQDVRAGRLPERLPVDADFQGSNPALAQAYEQAWLAVRLIAERDGAERLLRFYRAVGAGRDVEPEDAVATALRAQLGTTLDELTADWRAALRRQLA
ncbi:MAG: lipoprotein, partial [Frankiales bacterium]|nr:lipoprotein [Frankiales bacterium]